MLFATPLIYALLERATHDQIPLLAVGVGRADAADGRVFPYLFNPPTNYWSQNTAKIRFIGQRAGGMEQLKGRKIAHVYGDEDYGRETLPILDTQAAHYGFTVQHLAVKPPGLDQKATWLRVKVAQPDWVILRTVGVMTTTALKEAAQVGVPRDKIVGPYPTCSEQDMLPAGEAAIGFICALWWGTGRNFPLIQEMLQYVYGRGKGAGPERDVGTPRWNLGLLRALLTTEGIRTAMRQFGNQPLTGAQVQWGLEHLSLTPASLKELGAEGLISPLTLSCRDHEGGGGVQVPAVGREAVERAHRLDCAGSGAGAAPGGGVGGEVCAGEGHHAAGLPVGAWPPEPRSHGGVPPHPRCTEQSAAPDGLQRPLLRRSRHSAAADRGRSASFIWQEEDRHAADSRRCPCGAAPSGASSH